MLFPSFRRALVPAALGVLAAASTGFAENAADIVKTALEQHEQRLANVETLRVVQAIAGMEVVNEFEKQVVDGHAMLVPVGDGTPGTDFGSYFGHMEEIADNAKVAGKEKIDGADCWVLEIDDLSAFEEPEAGGGQDFEAKRGRFWIDRKDYLMRKMVLDGEATNAGETAPVTMEMGLRDYRVTDGLAWPFVTEMVIRGAAPGMSEEDLEEARESLTEMKAQMAQMPEDQRKMMEQMMGGQLQALEQMVESGEIRMAIEVTELTVNGG